MATKPVKFGTVTPELLAAAVDYQYYKDSVERLMALSDALNLELNELADGGCTVIQMEEPQVHMIPASGPVLGKLGMREMAGISNNNLKGLKDKTEVWCHTCWGNPSQQRMFTDIQKYGPALETINNVEADILTFESCSSNRMKLDKLTESSKKRRSRLV